MNRGGSPLYRNSRGSNRGGVYGDEAEEAGFRLFDGKAVDVEEFVNND